MTEVLIQRLRNDSSGYDVTGHAITAQLLREAADALASSQEALRAAERARDAQGVALSPSLANDALAVGMLLDDQRSRIDTYERVVYGVRQALGEDGLHAQLLDVPDVVRAALQAKEQEIARLRAEK